MKINITTILSKRNSLFLGAIAVGLIVGPGMRTVEWLNLPVLILIMTVAALELRAEYFRSAAMILKATFSGIILNLLVAGGIVLGLGYLLFPPGLMRDGIILAAACPPGLAIVPFTIVMGGSVAYSINAFSTGYIFSVFLMPFLTGLLIEKEVVSAGHVIGVMWKLILIPLVLSFVIKKSGLRLKAKNYYGPAVNLGFAVMFAILFGVNRHIFLHDPLDIAKLVFIFSVSIFALALVLKTLLKLKGVSRSKSVSILLSGTVKNSLFAAAIGLTLLGPEAAVPGTVLTFVIIAYLMVLGKLAGPS